MKRTLTLVSLALVGALGMGMIQAEVESYRTKSLIDPNNDFNLGGKLAAEETGPGAIEATNKEVKSGIYDLLLMTLDRHPNDHCSFSDISERCLNSPHKHPRHCVRNTPGSQVIPELIKPSAYCTGIKGTNKHFEQYGGLAAIVESGKYKDMELRSVIFNEVSIRGQKALERGNTLRCDFDLSGFVLEYCIKETAEEFLELKKQLEMLPGIKEVNINLCKQSIASLDPGSSEEVYNKLRRKGLNPIDDPEQDELEKKKQAERNQRRRW